MIRLFLAIISFLAVSASGLWYSFFSNPLTETAFENAALPPAAQMAEEGKVEEGVPGASENVSIPMEEASIPQAALPNESPAGSVPGREPVSQPEEKPASSGLSVEPHLLRFGYRLSPTSRTIDTVVLHSSYNASGGDEYDLEKTIAQYETYGVGAHYIIDRKGVIYRLVDEANIAYHAGASKMPDGRKNVNDFSIGIEMIANESDGYTEKQYAAVNVLIADIKTRYKIKNIVGHSDIAPTRKTDPWKFDWKKLK
ncbi:MAG: N-acetylmuramoyl-L-alanine amidase [Undibacterium sp.]